MVLEFPAFAMGTLGAADRAFAIWRNISSHKHFSDDIIDLMSRFELEIYRFQTWCSVVHSMAPEQARAPSHSGVNSNPSSETETELDVWPLQLDNNDPQTLNSSPAAPVHNAMAQIIYILEGVQKMLQQYFTPSKRASYQSSSASSASGTTPGSMTLGRTRPSTGLQAALDRQRTLREYFQRVSIWRRTTFGAAPWKESDKQMLQDKLEAFRHWNQMLIELLPAAMKESMTQHAVSALVLGSETVSAGELEAVGPRLSVSQEDIGLSASLRGLRERFDARNSDEGKPTEEELQGTVLSITGLAPDVKVGAVRFCSGTYVSRETHGIPDTLRVLIEWYSYDMVDIVLRPVAERRMKQLAYCCQPARKPPTLHVSDAIGFIDDDKNMRFGFITAYPSTADQLKPPVSLHDLVSRKVPSASLPSLEQRFSLSQQLTTALYSFMLIRWFHKSFESRNVILFANKDGTEDFGSPCIGGFDISRPDKLGELSLNKVLEAHRVYQHPELRAPDPSKTTRYHRKYEIYALGILLAEIGFWRDIATIVGRHSISLTAREFTAKLVSKCESELGCWMGSRYRDVTVRCLTLGESSILEESLDVFYLSVVLELMKCGSR